MKKVYQFTLDESVCVANGKDPQANELLQVMKTYGFVEESNSSESLTEDEIVLLSTYRRAKSKSKAEDAEKIRNLEALIESQRLEKEAIGKQIAKLFS